MSSIDEVIEALRNNSMENNKELERLLVKIASNILTKPDDQQVRKLRKNNATIVQKILGVSGAIKCLLLMGFHETETNLIFPMGASLKRLEDVKSNLSYMFEVATCADNLIKKPQQLPFPIEFQNQFLNSIAYQFHIVQAHDDKQLQQRAKSIIDTTDIELLAQRRIRAIQKKIKKGEIEDPNISIQDILILELLAWFKNEFFTWVDSPPCMACGTTDTKFQSMSTTHELLKYTPRVEMHLCKSCKTETPFPRYNDLNILLATRRGRCGEWANTFTLFCRAMGWDARQVFDETDHVWTEVYSIAQQRWVHCDSCENVCDTPLMYETGWNKQISYVIAYSGNDVQDVTWRYTSNFKEVLNRRNKCTEEDLSAALIQLRNYKRNLLSVAKKNFLNKRTILELLELMNENKTTDNDHKGRTSGTVAWRLARGECKSENTEYVWKFAPSDENASCIIQYSAAFDHYEYIENGECTQTAHWSVGILKMSNIFRKVEKDWKMVYLTRTEGTTTGSITWAFKIDKTCAVIDKVDVYFNYATYENGRVNVTLSGNNKLISFQKGDKELHTNDLSDCEYFEITATLSGGKGDVAWQHAQLFRQSLDSLEYPFKVYIRFKKL